MSSSRDLVERYVTAVNAEDWAARESVLATDAELHTLGFPPAVGRAEVVERFRGAFTPFAEHHDGVTRWIEAPDAVVCEIASSARLHDGRALSFAILDVLDGGPDGISRVASWYDTAEVARLLGG